MTNNKNNTIKHYFAAIVLVAVLLFLDQITKNWAYTQLRGNSSIPLIQGVLCFQYLENTGAAWGIMKGSRLLFMFIAALITAVVAILYKMLPDEHRYIYLRIPMILIVAGAIGNVIDRIRFHFVVDFIYFQLIDFPIFNVADIYITIAAVLLVLLIVFYYKDEDLDFIKRKN